MKHLAICFSLLSLVTVAATASRPDVLVWRQFLSNYLPVNHEVPLVLSAVNIGDQTAHDVTLSVYRQLYSNTTSTAPLTVRGALSVKFSKVQPGERVQHVVRVTLNRIPQGQDNKAPDQKNFMSIVGAPARVIYHGKNGQAYAGFSHVSKDKLPQVLLESSIQKYIGGNGWYWLVFSGMMSVTILLPLLTVCSFKRKYDDDKKKRVKKVNTDEDETTSSDNDRSKTKTKTKEAVPPPKQFYTATQVVKKRNRRE